MVKFMFQKICKYYIIVFVFFFLKKFRLTEAATTRGKHLVNKLNEICDAKQKTLNDKKGALEQLSLLTDHCIEFISRALDRGTDMAVLKTKTWAVRKMNFLEIFRAGANFAPRRPPPSLPGANREESEPVSEIHRFPVSCSVGPEI